MKRLSGVLILLLAILLVAGCGKTETTAQQPHNRQHAPNGDLLEITDSLSTPPSFLQPLGQDVQAAYLLAAQTADVLPWIPCYCGCGKSAGHKSNLNCFIKEIRQDGSVVWDDHGTRCKVCVDIAVTAARMKKEGKSAKEIRRFVDQTYQRGYADPTLTPFPA